MGTASSECDRTKRGRVIGVFSLVAGVLSGPMAVTAACLAADNALTEKTKETLGISLFAAIVGVILAFQVASLFYLWRRRPPGGKRLAVAGLLTTGGWLVLIFVWLALVFSSGEL